MAKITHNRDRETSLTSNLSPFRKDGKNNALQGERETCMTSNLSPFRKDGKNNA